MKIKPATKPGSVIMEMKGDDEKILTNAADHTTPFKIKNILVPVDFSPLAKKALQYAVPFSQKHGAKLLLVHTVEPVFFPENYLGALPPDIEDVNIDRAKTAKKQLTALREK